MYIYIYHVYIHIYIYMRVCVCAHSCVFMRVHAYTPLISACSSEVESCKPKPATRPHERRAGMGWAGQARTTAHVQRAQPP